MGGLGEFSRNFFSFPCVIRFYRSIWRRSKLSEAGFSVTWKSVANGMEWEEASWTCRGNPCSWIMLVEGEAVAFFVEGIKVRYWYLCRLSHFTREGRNDGYCRTFWQEGG